MNLSLHIGHGKTASAYLQSWIAFNAAQPGSSQKLLYQLKILVLSYSMQALCMGLFVKATVSGRFAALFGSRE